jgi:hypothetical protein
LPKNGTPPELCVKATRLKTFRLQLMIEIQHETLLYVRTKVEARTAFTFIQTPPKAKCYHAEQ